MKMESVSQAAAKSGMSQAAAANGLKGGGEDYVVFDRVQKSYDGVSLIVADLNLNIRQGEFLTMLGPSGSGKTTCLMMPAGFETATHGEIRLAGRDINRVPSHILHCRLNAAGCENFIVKMRNTLGQKNLASGDRIRIGWHPQDARALDPYDRLIMDGGGAAQSTDKVGTT